MHVNLTASAASLAQIHQEITRLKAHPLPVQCPLAILVMEQLATEMETEVQDQALELIKFISPSHSWLRVPVTEIERLKLAYSFSGFSYRSTLYYYLETDCDMTVFLEARDAEGRSVADWAEQTVKKFPHLEGVKRLDTFPRTQLTW